MTAAVSELAYHAIRKMLTRGELLPGQRLYQSRLARQFQCSPMPVVDEARREFEAILTIAGVSMSVYFSKRNVSITIDCSTLP